MARPNRRIVTHRPDGTWGVTAPNDVRDSSVHDTQAEAIARAREVVKNLGGGELTIQREGGQFREGRTIPPGNDPYPPKG